MTSRADSKVDLNTVGVKPGMALFGYLSYLGGLLLSFALALMVLMDMRKGFLFPRYVLKTPWINLHPHQIWLLIIGIGGAFLCHRLLRMSEERGEMDEEQRRVLARLTSAAVFALLTGTLIVLIRGLGMVRVLNTGKLAIGALGLGSAQLWATAELMPVKDAPYLLKPLAVTVNYLALVWDATIIGMLLAGLTVTAFPLYFNRLLAGRGGRLRQMLGGLVYGIPQPFCSCCASPISATLYKSTGSVAASVAFLLTSPTLNISTLILAAVLLPVPFAALRIAGGLLFVFSVASLAARLGEKAVREADGERPPAEGRFLTFINKVFNRYCNLFHFESAERSAQSPAVLLSSWLANSWREFKVVYPTMIVGGLVAGAIVTFFPVVFSNDVGGVVRAALLGTLLMVGTWTEIPVTSVLAGQGLSGPAAALLVTLPTVSLPCLLIFGGALRNARIAVLLGAATFIFGVAAGVFFL